MRSYEEIRKDRRIKISREIHMEPIGYGFEGTVRLTGDHGARTYYLIFTREAGEGGKIEREHASVSRCVGTALPGWTEMEELKEILWQDEEECYQVHPKKSQYVNMVSHCLHIWHDVEKERGGRT